MNEILNNQANRYKIVNSINNLSLLKEIITLFGEFEIEPFKEFSLAFQAEYWYLKYHLLQDNAVQLEMGEFSSVYEEQGLNVIWLSVKDNESFILECRDGGWFISFLKPNENINAIFANFKLISTL